MKTFALLIALMAAPSYASSDYMHFLIETMDLSRSPEDLIVRGETIAKKLYISMDDNEFFLEQNHDESFVAQTYLLKNRFYFSKDGLTFSTAFEEDNIIFELEKLKARNADIELSTELIAIQADYLEANTREYKFLVENIDMHCKTDGEFTSDIDIACLRNTTILPNHSKKSLIKIENLLSPNTSQFKIDLTTESLAIFSDRLDIKTHSMMGRINESQFQMSEGLLTCFKDPQLKEMDFDKILIGCLKYSRLFGANFTFRDNTINARISHIDLQLDENSLKIHSDFSQFYADQEETIVRGLKLKCHKVNNSESSLNDKILIKGCLKEMSLSLSQLDSDSKQYLKKENKDLIDLSNVKNINFRIIDGNFTLKGKTKLLFRVPLKLKGHVSYDQNAKALDLHVRKAQVLGISATSLSLYLLRKFLSSQSIEIRENKIKIKL